MAALETLRNFINNYKIGDGTEGSEKLFEEATSRQIENIKVRICFYGSTGVGKTSLVNSMAVSLGHPPPAIIQDAGGEGTECLEEFYFQNADFRLLDTRGIGELCEDSEAELQQIIQGRIKETEIPDRNITRTVYHMADLETAHIEVSDLINVVVWCVSATDPRLRSGKYHSLLRFTTKILGGCDGKDYGLSVLIAVTNSDRLSSEEERAEIKIKIDEMFGRKFRNKDIFFISNYDEPTYSDSGNHRPFLEDEQIRVLQLLKQSLLIGEANIRNRISYQKKMKQQTLPAAMKNI